MGSVSKEATVPVRAAVRPAVSVLAAVTLFLLLSWNSGHYWDEYFYLFSVWRHTPSELVRYEFRTELFPVGFFSEKIGHVALLYVLTRVFGAGERVLYGLQTLYALLLVGFVGAAYGLLRELFAERWARHSAVVLLFSPLALYLSWKTMSEVPSLLLTTLGSWAFVRSLPGRSQGPGARWLALATLLLAAGMLCRVTTIVAFTGLGLALVIVGDGHSDRRNLLLRLAGTVAAAALLHSAGLALAGGSVLRIGSHIHSVVTEHSSVQRVYAFVFFVQALGLVVPFAWLRRSDRLVQVGVVWLAASALPVLAGHEPRYFAPAMVPLALLAAVGFGELSRLMFGPGRRYGWVLLLGVLALADRVVLVPLMPYEVEQGHLLSLFASLQQGTPGATFLIPWTSDYSLLRFSFPDARIELSLDNTPGSRSFRAGRGSLLSQDDQWWAGATHYAGSPAALATLPGPRFLIGWTYNPAALRLQQLLGSLGVPSRFTNSRELHNHLVGTWVWHDPAVALTPIRRLGEYRAFELRELPRQ